MLEALHPGRIDLGIGRAPGHRPAHRLRAAPWPGRARRRRLPRAAHRAARLLLRLAPRRSPVRAHHRGAGARLPAGDLDARLEHLRRAGGGRARHAVLVRVPLRAGDARRRARGVPRARSGRQPSSTQPYLMLGVSVVCGESDEHARWLAAPGALAFLRLRSGSARRLPDAGGGGRVPVHAVRAPAGGAVDLVARDRRPGHGAPRARAAGRAHRRRRADGHHDGARACRAGGVVPPPGVSDAQSTRSERPVDQSDHSTNVATSTASRVLPTLWVGSGSSIVWTTRGAAVPAAARRPHVVRANGTDAATL